MCHGGLASRISFLISRSGVLKLLKKIFLSLAIISIIYKLFRKSENDSFWNEEGYIATVAEFVFSGGLLDFVLAHLILIGSLLMCAIIGDIFLIAWTVGSLMKEKSSFVRAMKVPVKCEELFNLIVRDILEYPKWSSEIFAIENKGSTSFEYVSKKGSKFEMDILSTVPHREHIREIKCVCSRFTYPISMLETLVSTTYIFEFDGDKPDGLNESVDLYVVMLEKCKYPIVRFFVNMVDRSRSLEVLLKDISSKFGISDVKISKPINGKISLED